jgi:hypothetical protein
MMCPSPLIKFLEIFKILILGQRGYIENGRRRSKGTGGGGSKQEFSALA